MTYKDYENSKKYTEAELCAIHRAFELELPDDVISVIALPGLGGKRMGKLIKDANWGMPASKLKTYAKECFSVRQMASIYKGYKLNVPHEIMDKLLTGKFDEKQMIELERLYTYNCQIKKLWIYTNENISYDNIRKLENIFNEHEEPELLELLNTVNDNEINHFIELISNPDNLKRVLACSDLNLSSDEMIEILENNPKETKEEDYDL